ncbi:hypothetical protein F5883DRAFT_526135 [Diaporthe sp. PMI_573]|nr:hypothetical protein F5883DRAFT_526135 [Diaporthaceae sp. PMI_573]
MQRVWRGFLLYELLCVMHGQPMVTADVEYSQCVREDEDLTECFRRISQDVREEFICVQHYMLEQYHLALNTVTESFRLAVNEMGRCATASTPPSTELLEDDFPELVQYLFSEMNFTYDPKEWAKLLAMLGVSFMQQFLCWDSTTRLDFIRTTYPVLHECTPITLHHLFEPDIKMRVAMDQRFGWPRSQFTIDETNLRLRAVGWIFWEDPDRLAAMDLVRGAADRTYDSDEHGIIPYIKLDYRPFRKERSLEPQEWDRIVQEFGQPPYDDQLFDVKRLFLSIGDLNPDRIAEMVSIWRRQYPTCVQAEAKDNNE